MSTKEPDKSINAFLAMDAIKHAPSHEVPNHSLNSIIAGLSLLIGQVSRVADALEKQNQISGEIQFTLGELLVIEQQRFHNGA